MAYKPMPNGVGLHSHCRHAQRRRGCGDRRHRPRREPADRELNAGGGKEHAECHGPGDDSIARPQQSRQQRRSQRQHEGRRGDAGREYRDAGEQVAAVPPWYTRDADPGAGRRLGSVRDRHPDDRDDRGRQQRRLDGEDGYGRRGQ